MMLMFWTLQLFPALYSAFLERFFKLELVIESASIHCLKFLPSTVRFKGQVLAVSVDICLCLNCVGSC